MSDHIHTVNALNIRNQFGEVLELLESSGQPIMVSKGRKVRAVLITPEDFQARFVDRLADDAREQRLAELRGAHVPADTGATLDQALRNLRGALQGCPPAAGGRGRVVSAGLGVAAVAMRGGRGRPEQRNSLDLPPQSSYSIFASLS